MTPGVSTVPPTPSITATAAQPAKLPIDPATRPTAKRVSSALAIPVVSALIRLALWLIIPAYLVFVALQTTFLQGIYIATMRDMYFGCMQFVDPAYALLMRPGTCALKNLEYDVTMTHDSAGFRNHDGLPAARIAVLGDSHAYGHGVGDGQTFSALLAQQLGEPVRNLAVPASATLRELEAYTEQTPAADLIVLQYCDNDLDENISSLSLAPKVYQATLRKRMSEVMNNYALSKRQGKLGQSLLTLSYAAQQLVRARFVRLPPAAPDESTLAREADAFVRVLAQYQPALAGKTVVVLESSGWGRNRKAFQTVFEQRLRSVPQVRWVVLDSSVLLRRSDYFRLDDHLNASGHSKLALALAEALRPYLTERGPDRTKVAAWAVGASPGSAFPGGANPAWNPR